MFQYFFPNWIQVALFICKPGQVSSPLKLIRVLWINVVPELTCIQTQQLFLTFAVMYGDIISLITDCKGNSFVFLRICLWIICYTSSKLSNTGLKSPHGPNKDK